MGLRDESKKSWSARDVVPTEGELRLGALQRIADACEKMTVNFQSLTLANANLSDEAKRLREAVGTLERRLRAQRAATTRAKRGRVPPLFGRWQREVRRIDAMLKKRNRERVVVALPAQVRIRARRMFMLAKKRR